MTKLRETFDDVAALIPRYSWEIMDEEQRDQLMVKVVLPRYMKTTRDGVQLGPKAWAEVVGTTASAITNRVYRLNQAKTTIARADRAAAEKSAQRHAKAVLRNPQQRQRVLKDLSPVERAAVVRDAVPAPEKADSRRRTGPSFIDLLVRVSSALIELEALVASWQNPSAVPAEFSRESFNDIVAKVLRIEEKFDALRNAIDNEDEDEFQKIVRNFRVTADVR